MFIQQSIIFKLHVCVLSNELIYNLISRFVSNGILNLSLIFQEEDIRLYSCLANGSADEFVKGEHMLKIKAVKEPLQIGNLSILI